MLLRLLLLLALTLHSLQLQPEQPPTILPWVYPVPYLHCSQAVRDHLLVAVEPYYSGSFLLAGSAMVEVPPDCLLPAPVPGMIHCALVLLLLVVTAVVVMLVFVLVYPTDRLTRLYHRLLVVHWL
jgi:hypothetical protein